MTNSIRLTDKVLDSWADDPTGPVALSLRQKLAPVEGPDGVVFPPTYADLGPNKTSGYNIDELGDGTRVATLDSVGSQANRREPLFLAASDGQPENPLAKLVPQVAIELEDGRLISLLAAGHRLGDALVRCSGLAEDARSAFEEFQRTGDATKIAQLGPTSLVFGAWDSRDTQAKLPRVVQATVRAWSVDELHRSAQYGPPINYDELEIFSKEEREKAEGNAKSPLAQRGFVHVPAGRAPGGVIARGGITLDLTVNLVALRRLRGEGDGSALRRYILGLALVSAVEPLDGFYRQGCLLTPDPEAAERWVAVQRDGSRPTIDLTPDLAREYAKRSAKAFGVGPDRTEPFSKERAKSDVVGDKAGKAKAAKKSKAK